MPVTLLFVNVAARPGTGCAPRRGRASGRRVTTTRVVHLSATHSKQPPVPRQWASLANCAADRLPIALPITHHCRPRTGCVAGRTADACGPASVARASAVLWGRRQAGTRAVVHYAPGPPSRAHFTHRRPACPSASSMRSAIIASTTRHWPVHAVRSDAARTAARLGVRLKALGGISSAPEWAVTGANSTSQTPSPVRITVAYRCPL